MKLVNVDMERCREYEGGKFYFKQLEPVRLDQIQSKAYKIKNGKVLTDHSTVKKLVLHEGMTRHEDVEDINGNPIPFAPELTDHYPQELRDLLYLDISGRSTVADSEEDENP